MTKLREWKLVDIGPTGDPTFVEGPSLNHYETVKVIEKSAYDKVLSGLKLVATTIPASHGQLIALDILKELEE